MFFHRKQNVQGLSWDFMRLRVYDTYIYLGCGGRDREALPILKAFMDIVDKTRHLAGYTGEPCTLHDDNGYFTIINLKDFSNQAAWMLVGMLINDKWIIHKYEFENSTVQLIDMIKV